MLVHVDLGCFAIGNDNHNHLVDLVRRYSNRSDLLGPLARAWKMINSAEDHCNEEITYVQSQSPKRVPPASERLGEGELARMAELYVSPYWTGEAVAKRYGISVRTVRRLMRERGVRKRLK